MCKKSTNAWVRSKGKWALNVKGAFDLSGCRYSLATYEDSHGLFEVYAFFKVRRGFNEPYMQKHVGRRLQKLFNAGKYICIAENGTGHRIDRKFCRLEFYAFCERPEPSKVCQIKDIVRDCIKSPSL